MDETNKDCWILNLWEILVRVKESLIEKGLAMKIQPQLDESALRAACLKTAENILWNRKPFDAAPIKDLAESYFTIAVGLLDSYCQDYDPNILVRAVYYLAQIALPSRENIAWFENGLMVLLELVCPTTSLDEESSGFMRDIENGIAEIKSGSFVGGEQIR